MLRLLVVVSLASFCLCADPIYEGEHFKVFRLKDAPLRRNGLTERREGQDVTERGLRAFVEYPYNGTAPLDDGSALFGDIEFDYRPKDGELIVRDNIVNRISYEDIIIYYNRSLPGYYVEDVRIFNVGRQRGFASYAGFYPSAGYVEVDIIVAAYNTVRTFIEIYVRE